MAHLTLLLVLLWVGTTVSTVVDVDKRIIGGRDCTRDERPYHVKLIDNNNNLVCGGSLINNQWILTVAHCWEDGFDISFTFRNHPRPTEPVKITTKPEKFLHHDIMLLKFDKPLTAFAKPIELGDCKYKPGKGSTVQIAGHAATTTGRNKELICDYSPALQCANIKVADCGDITQLTRETHTTSKHWFCGHTPGVSSCPGDSGGGVVYKGRLYGLIRGSGQHLNQLPVRFIDICDPDFADWIKRTAPRQ